MLNPLPRPRGNPGTRKTWHYLNAVCAFDIETTRIQVNGDNGVEDHAIPYLWQFCLDDKMVIYGRNLQEFVDLMEAVAEQIPEDARLVVYVHNLSYEFFFLVGHYPFASCEVFAMDSRKILKCSMYNDKIEFKCSYIQTNMSLAAFLIKMGVSHQKTSMDYSVKRYPWTPLSDSELEYALNDVIGLVEAIKLEMKRDGDTLYTIPPTATGYVRRDAKAALRKAPVSHAKLMSPSLELFHLFRDAFRGGNTHANRYYAGVVLHNVDSYDRASSYPDVMCNCEFPMSQFREWTGNPPTEADVIRWSTLRGRACIFRVTFKDLRLINELDGCPYLSIDKCVCPGRLLADNGRILACTECRTALTDVDFRIVREQYQWSALTITELWWSTYGSLPEEFTSLIKEYYHAKTSKKGVEGEEAEYDRSKARINSLYGMSVTNPLRDELIFCIDDEEEWQAKDKPPLTDTAALIEYERNALKKANHRAFIPYAWGVWVTAWARYKLQQGINAATLIPGGRPGEGFVYADTDSVKCVGYFDIENFNRESIKQSRRSGATAIDRHGVEHPMGVFEKESDKSGVDFITLGAKKYVYAHPGEASHITIAGVGKKKGGAELDKLGGLKILENIARDPLFSLTFTEAGGTESVYNDKVEPRDLIIDGHSLTLRRNVCIRDSTYTLGITAEYFNLLNHPEIFEEFIQNQLDKISPM